MDTLGRRSEVSFGHTKELRLILLSKFFNVVLIGYSIFCFVRPILAEDSVPIGYVVAIVGDGVITNYDLQKEIGAIKRQLKARNTLLPNEEEITKQVLERLINRKILMDFAERSGIRVSSEELGEGIAQFAKAQNTSVSELLASLELQGNSAMEDFRKQVENELKLDKLRRRELDSKIRVSDIEIDRFIDKLNETPVRDEYLAAHILLKIRGVGDPSPRNVAMEKASEALRRIDGGGDFRTVAAELSEASDALEGGLLGWRFEEQLPTLFLEKLRLMKLGERSDIFESPNGFHILFLYDKRGATQKIVVEQTHVSHILVKINQYEDEDIVRSRAQEIRDRIVLGGEAFSELAKNLSTDISAGNGGDLGWLGPGETVPEFERAMNLLAVGEISEVIRSQFGFHIILVHGRRDADLSSERKRAQAFQTIIRRKLESRFEGWVQELRDKTFVEIKAQ
jgi:peptidyl-prolyl cis-trans isomerase SurA